MRRRRAASSTSSVRRSCKSTLPPAVPSAAISSEQSFAGASVIFVGADFVAVVMVKTSKGEEEENDKHPSCPQPCTSAGSNDCLVNSVAARPHGLIAVLRRFGVILRRHIQPIGGGGHLWGPLLRARTAPACASALGLPLHKYVDGVQGNVPVSQPVHRSGSPTATFSTSFPTVIVAASKNKENLSFSSFCLSKRVDCVFIIAPQRVDCCIIMRRTRRKPSLRRSPTSSYPSPPPPPPPPPLPCPDTSPDSRLFVCIALPPRAAAHGLIVVLRHQLTLLSAYSLTVHHRP